MATEVFDMLSPLIPSDSRADDVLVINELWSQIGEENLDAIKDDPEKLRAIMAGLDYLVIRANTIPKIIGAVSVMRCSDELAKIDSLAVAPKSQLKGYGKQLAVGAIDHCAQEGYKELCTTAMPSSVKLFRSVGFEAFEKNKSGNTTMFLDLS